MMRMIYDQRFHINGIIMYMYTYMYLYMYTYTYLYMYIHVYMYVCTVFGCDIAVTEVVLSNTNLIVGVGADHVGGHRMLLSLFSHSERRDFHLSLM